MVLYNCSKETNKVNYVVGKDRTTSKCNDVTRL